VPRIFGRDIQRRYNRIRVRLRLPRTWTFPMYASLSSDLYLQPSCEAFEYLGPAAAGALHRAALRQRR
jgi:hypothetical protein